MFARTSLVILGTAALTLGGCSSKHVSWGNASHRTAGPPAHAPAYGHNKKFKYHYYPDAQVYHDSASGNYFWMEGAQWKMGVSLPTYVSVDFSSGVSVELDSDKPYNHHSNVARAHPGKGRKLGHAR